jgi:hypothetical protein
MILYFLIALVILGTLWLFFALSRVALSAWILRSKTRKAALHAASRQLEAVQEPGGNPDNPILIDTPSVVEAKASACGCPFCDVDMRVRAHRAFEHNGRRLRVAELMCAGCGHRRNIYFELKQVS